MDVIRGLFSSAPPPLTQIPGTLPTLSTDVLIEILSWMDTTVPLRSVCRTFCTLIKPDRANTQKCVRIAAQSGYIALLLWAEKQKGSLEKVPMLAAYGGNLTTLKWLLETKRIGDNSFPSIDDAKICEAAALGGHLAVIQWARSWNCPYGDTTPVAAGEGHLDVLQWAVANGATTHYLTWLNACESGKFHVLLWGLITKKIKFVPSLCCAAARGGHLNILKWLRNNNCPWDTTTTADAAIHGHHEVFYYALYNHCPIYLTEDLSNQVASKGHYEMVKVLHYLGCPLGNSICSSAASSGNLDLLKWLRSLSLPWGRTTSSAAVFNRLEILQWAHLESCPWDNNTLYDAAQFKHFELLDWAYCNGAPWDQRLENFTEPKVITWVQSKKTCIIS